MSMKPALSSGACFLPTMFDRSLVTDNNIVLVKHLGAGISPKCQFGGWPECNDSSATELGITLYDQTVATPCDLSLQPSVRQITQTNADSGGKATCSSPVGQVISKVVEKSQPCATVALQFAA